MWSPKLPPVTFRVFVKRRKKWCDPFWYSLVRLTLAIALTNVISPRWSWLSVIPLNRELPFSFFHSCTTAFSFRLLTPHTDEFGVTETDGQYQACECQIRARKFLNIIETRYRKNACNNLSVGCTHRSVATRYIALLMQKRYCSFPHQRHLK